MADPAPGPSLVKDGLFLLSANTLNNAVAFAALLVAARLMPLSDYGVLGLAVALVVLTATVTDFGSSVALVRRVNASGTDPRIAGAALLRWKLAAGFGLVVLALALPADAVARVLPLLAPADGTLLVAMISAGLLGLWTSLRALEQAREDFEAMRRDAAACAVLRAGAFTLLLTFGTLTPEAVLACLYVVPLGALVAVRAAALLGAGRSGPDPRNDTGERALRGGTESATPSLLHYSAWIGLSSLCFIALTRAPLFALSADEQGDALGLFTAALTLALAFGQLGDGLRAVLLPRSSRARHAGQRQAIRRELWRRAGPLFALAAGLLVLLVLAYPTLLGDAHARGAPLLLVIGLATLATAYFGLHNTLLHAHGRPQLDAAVNLVRLALLAGLLAALPPDPFAIALAYAATLTGGEALLYLLVRRLDRVPAPALAAP